MKRLILHALCILAFTLFTHHCFAQKQGQEKIDSLLSHLSQAKEDTSKVNLLIDLSFTYHVINPDEGLKYADQAYALADKLSASSEKAVARAGEKAKGFAYMRKGNNYSTKAESDHALECYLQALPIFERIKEKDGMVRAFINIGSIYYSKSNYQEALQYFNKSYELSKEIGSQAIMAASLECMGNVYSVYGDYPKSLDCYLKSLKIREETNDKTIASSYNVLALHYRSQGDYDQSLVYYKKAVELNTSQGNKLGLGNSLMGMGGVYILLRNDAMMLDCFLKVKKIAEELGDKNMLLECYANLGVQASLANDFTAALQYHLKALELSKELGERITAASNFSGISYLYYAVAQSKDPEARKKFMNGDVRMILRQAKSYMDSAIKICDELGILSQQVDNYIGLVQIQTLAGDYKGALESVLIRDKLKDSVYNMDKNKQLVQKSMQYEFDKKEVIAKAEQEKKDTMQRNIRNSITGGLGGALIFLVVAFRQRNKIKKEKLNAEAEKQKSDELLLNILPAEVAEELKTSGAAKAKSYTMVTVMFTDFKGFTTVSEKVSAELLVDEIHYCFSAFDRIIQKYKIEKIKTIGDAYLCASGLPVSSYTHATDMLSAAMEIRNFMLERKKEKEAIGEIPFELRIGIHTGSVVAGIVGVKKYAYDIWGDTVNLAARMEQNSEAGKINISGSTFELVKDKFICEHRGKIEAKNKGMIDMYFAEN